MKTARINQRTIGTHEQIYLIAEMACAHDGDIEKALNLIKAAAHSGADAIQLQFFSTKDLVTPNHAAYDVLKKIEFDKDTWIKIASYARKFPIDLFVCVFDIPSAILAIELNVDGIKLNSSDLSNPDILKIVAKSKIPFTLGTGASHFEDIAQAIETIETAGAKDLILMHGVQNFPTDIMDAHIWRVRMLDELFSYPVGYADHTDASQQFAHHVDLIAIGAGAALLEKHITLDRREKGTDYQAALEPDEFSNWVKQIRMAEMARGPKKAKKLSAADHAYRIFQKKSIVASRNIEKGEIFKAEMLKFLRTSGDPGIPPTEINNIIGKTATSHISIYDKLENSHFA